MRNAYLLGYRDGVNDYSWSVDFFFGEWQIINGKAVWVKTKNPPPPDIKLNAKQVAEHGFNIPAKERCDYYIVRMF